MWLPMVLAGGSPRKDRHHDKYCSLVRTKGKSKHNGVAKIRPALVCAFARNTSAFDRDSESLSTLVSARKRSVLIRESSFNTTLPILTLNSLKGENTEPSRNNET